MIDPIKKYVEENREAFDHLEPPVDVLQRIQSRLKHDAIEKNRTTEKNSATEKSKAIPLFSKRGWLVAASVLLAITTTYILNNNTSQDKNPDKIAHQSAQKNTTDHPVEKNSGQQTQQDKPLRLARIAPRHRLGNGLRLSEKELAAMPTKDLYARLRDSSSASIRLSAVLEIEKTGVNDNILDSLAKTLNNDSNTNVRMAALSVIGQYADDKHASSLLVRSFSTQNDPLVQLGLVGLIGKVENAKVEHRLFALAEDPNTFAAVKEEAYAALLNQNKL